MTIKEFFIGIKNRTLEYWKLEATLIDYAIMVIAKTGAFVCGLGLGYYLWG